MQLERDLSTKRQVHGSVDYLAKCLLARRLSAKCRVTIKNTSFMKKTVNGFFFSIFIRWNPGNGTKQQKMNEIKKRKEFEENIFLKLRNETELTATVNSFRYRTK
jgi:hypothetical protein